MNSCAIKWHSFLCRFPQDRLVCVTQKWKIRTLSKMSPAIQITVSYDKVHAAMNSHGAVRHCGPPRVGTARGVSIFGHNYGACAGQNALWPQQVAQRASIFLLLLLFCDFCPRETHEHNSGWVQVFCFCPKDSASSQGRPEHALARAGDTDCGPLGPINTDPARGDHGRVGSSSPVRPSSKV